MLNDSRVRWIGRIAIALGILGVLCSYLIFGVLGQHVYVVLSQIVEQNYHGLVQSGAVIEPAPTNNGGYPASSSLNHGMERIVWNTFAPLSLVVFLWSVVQIIMGTILMRATAHTGRTAPVHS